MGLATAGDPPGCPSAHPPLRLGRCQWRRSVARRNARRCGWPAVEAVNTSAVALVTIAAGPANDPGPQARRTALRTAGDGGARG